MPSLNAPPPHLVETRTALHRLAAYVMAPVRYQATERFGLRALEGGFGTPPFGDRQLIVSGITLTDRNDGSERQHELSTLAQAAEFLGSTIDEETAAEHDTPAAGDHTAALAVDLDASSYLGEWFSVAFAALHAVRADSESVDASEPQLWPGHFDPAIEIGDENHRASYGASPGDDSSDVPYLYASVWWPDRLSLDTEDPYWNATSFTGAVLKATDLTDGDPVAQAAAFWREARDRIAAG